jgi:S-adenosylmethionine hydrolase
MKKIMRSKDIHIEIPGGKILSLVKNFSQVSEGSCGALIGSSRLLEIVAQNESASRLLGLVGGEVIHLHML